MSMALSAFGRILLVSSACAIELLVCIVVRVCGWPNSLSVVHMEMAGFALMNSAASSASAADDITDFITCEMLRTAPLLIGILSSPAMNMWLPARLLTFGSDR